MTGTGTTNARTARAAVVPTAGDDVLVESLGRLFPASAGAIVSVRLEPIEFATLCSVERLTVDFSTGRSLALFTKHLDERHADHPDKARRDREALVYERLLAPSVGLPAPRFYGSRQDKGRCDTQLFLEFVDDWSLKYQELSHWYEAAKRLGELHAHFAARADELRGCGFLLQLRQPYFVAWADRARAVTSQLSPNLGKRLARALRGYPGIADGLGRQPVTLVHNDLAPKNVIADRSASPARICFVDWEMAGVGCGLLDLVHLKYGLEPASGATMVATYRRALSGSGALPEDDREFARLLAACELHKTLYRLAHCDRWALPVERVAEWVDDARSFASRATGGAS